MKTGVVITYEGTGGEDVNNANFNLVLYNVLLKLMLNKIKLSGK